MLELVNLCLWGCLLGFLAVVTWHRRRPATRSERLLRALKVDPDIYLRPPYWPDSFKMDEVTQALLMDDEFNEAVRLEDEITARAERRRARWAWLPWSRR